MEKQWKMTTADFYALLKAQGYRCSLSKEELTPETTCIARVLPIEQGGKHELANTYLVHRNIYPLTRTCSLNEIIQICKKVASKRQPFSPIKHRLEKSHWKLFHDRIITINKSSRNKKQGLKKVETWANAAIRTVTKLNQKGDIAEFTASST